LYRLFSTMKVRRTVLGLFLIACCTFSISFGQEDVDPAAEEANSSEAEDQSGVVAEPPAPILFPSPDVVTVYLFPGSPSRKFVVADSNPIQLLVGFTNEASSNTFNITSIQASLMYPQDHRYYIQNYTRQSYGISVQGGEQVTLLYKFLPDPNLDARDFDLTATVFYHDLVGGNFSSVVFNDTFSLTDRADSVNAQLFFTYVGIAGVLGLVAFFIFKKFFAAPSKKSGRGRLETGTRSEVPADQNEWLAGTSARVDQRRTPPRKSKSPKP